MEKSFRSGCPIASTLDIVGDKWSLLVIRDMLLHHKTISRVYRFRWAALGYFLRALNGALWADYRKKASRIKENLYLLTKEWSLLQSRLISVFGATVTCVNSMILNTSKVSPGKEFIIDTVKQRYSAFIQEFTEDAWISFIRYSQIG